MGAKDGGSPFPSDSPFVDRVVVTITLFVCAYLAVRAIW
jgi:hypothetical protein